MEFDVRFSFAESRKPKIRVRPTLITSLPSPYSRPRATVSVSIHNVPSTVHLVQTYDTVSVVGSPITIFTYLFNSTRPIQERGEGGGRGTHRRSTLVYTTMSRPTNKWHVPFVFRSQFRI